MANIFGLLTHSSQSDSFDLILGQSFIECGVISLLLTLR